MHDTEQIQVKMKVYLYKWIVLSQSRTNITLLPFIYMHHH